MRYQEGAFPNKRESVRKYFENNRLTLYGIIVEASSVLAWTAGHTPPPLVETTEEDTEPEPPEESEPEKEPGKTFFDHLG